MENAKMLILNNKIDKDFKAILNLKLNEPSLIKFYNLSKARKSLALGIKQNESVLKVPLQLKENNCSFSLPKNVDLQNNLFCAVVDVTNAFCPEIVLSGSLNTEDENVKIESAFTQTKPENTSVLYEEDEDTQIEALIDKNLEEDMNSTYYDNCANCKYRQAFYEGCGCFSKESQNQNSIKNDNDFISAKDTYVQKDTDGQNAQNTSQSKTKFEEQDLNLFKKTSSENSSIEENRNSTNNFSCKLNLDINKANNTPKKEDIETKSSKGNLQDIQSKNYSSMNSSKVNASSFNAYNTNSQNYQSILNSSSNSNEESFANDENSNNFNSLNQNDFTNSSLYEFENSNNSYPPSFINDINEGGVDNKCSSQIEEAYKQENIEDRNEKFKNVDDDNFYMQIKSQVESLFKKYKSEDNLKALISNSKWVKVNYENSENYYCLGLIYDDNNTEVLYIAYAVPSNDSKNPPEDLKDYAQWLEVENIDNFKGYHIVYQDAKTGDTIKVNFV